MQIVVNTDNQIEGRESLQFKVEAEIRDAVGRFEEDITRVEAHLGDVNAGKSGEADKRCALEARPAGRKPVAVEHRAASLEEAYEGAAEKLARLLESSLGKRDDVKGAPSVRDNPLRTG